MRDSVHTSPRQTRTILLALLAASLSAAVGLWWLCTRSDDFAFLPARKGAEWIIRSEPPSGEVNQEAPVVTIFRRNFTLSRPPTNATLMACAFKTAGIAINGQSVTSIRCTGQNWKSPSTANVAGLLRAGTNEIAASVTNRLGPPALWLRLEADQLSLGSDERWPAFVPWAGWQESRRASAPVVIPPGSPLYGAERTADSLRRIWPLLLAFCAVSLTLVFGASRWLRRQHMAAAADRTSPPTIVTYAPLAVVLIARALLFLNNLPQLPHGMGFDADAHEEYIEFIRQNHKLPFANQGWEMFQPPLYYAGSALLLEACKLSLSDDAGGLVVRAVNGVAGLANCWLAFLCLRLLFPGNLPAQTAGLLVAAFVPPHLYLSQYITNEPLSGVFVTLALYFCLRLFRGERESLRLHIALGLALGAAMLTKSSALLAVPLFLAALGLRLLARQRYAPRAWLRTVAAVIVPCLLVCGWYYARVWARFGRPIVGNWERDTGPAWWQDPGFQTASFYSHFGQALISPLFGSFQSFADGLYSTLWGDGMISGIADVATRPPWNYDLMAAASFLALGLSLLLLIGLVRSLISLCRQPAPDWFLVTGLVGVFSLGILYMSLRVPSHAQVKAFYALPVLVPFSALVAAGWDWLRHKLRTGQITLWTLLLVWSMATGAAFWVRRSNAVTQQVRGLFLASSHRYTEATEALSRALEMDPELATAHNILGKLLLEQGKTEEAAAHFRAALKRQPGLAGAHYSLGYALLEQQQTDQAVEEFRRALRLSLNWSPETLNDMALLLATRPDSDAASMAEKLDLAEKACRMALHRKPDLYEVHTTLGTVLVQEGKLEEAAIEFSTAVKAQPDNADAHYNLGDVFLRQQRTEQAIAAYRQALRLKSDWPPLGLNNMAWLLATHPDPDLRNGPEAIKLAERACVLTGNKDISFLETLAAAYAECGQFKQAADTAHRAYELAMSTSQGAWTNLAKRRLDIYSSHRSLRQAGP